LLTDGTSENSSSAKFAAWLVTAHRAGLMRLEFTFHALLLKSSYCKGVECVSSVSANNRTNHRTCLAHPAPDARRLGSSRQCYYRSLFFHGHVVSIKTLYLVIIMITGTVSLLLVLAGGITWVVVAHRRRELDQRELAVLFSLMLFAIGGWFGLIPGISHVPTIAE
jgi:hypothetical protein